MFVCWRNALATANAWPPNVSIGKPTTNRASTRSRGESKSSAASAAKAARISRSFLSSSASRRLPVRLSSRTRAHCAHCLVLVLAIAFDTRSVRSDIFSGRVDPFYYAPRGQTSFRADALMTSISSRISSNSSPFDRTCLSSSLK